MSVQIINNALTASVADEIENFLTGNSFPWFYNKEGVVYADSNGSYFTHIFYFDHTINSEFFNVVKPFFELIKPRSLYRIKANLYPQTTEIIEHGFHTDYSWNDLHTAVYYVNSNDGYTALESGGKIESIKNRLAILGPLVSHSSSTSTQMARVTLNFNWF